MRIKFLLFGWLFFASFFTSGINRTCLQTSKQELTRAELDYTLQTLFLFSGWEAVKPLPEWSFQSINRITKELGYMPTLLQLKRASERYDSSWERTLNRLDLKRVRRSQKWNPIRLKNAILILYKYYPEYMYSVRLFKKIPQEALQLVADKDGVVPSAKEILLAVSKTYHLVWEGYMLGLLSQERYHLILFGPLSLAEKKKRIKQDQVRLSLNLISRVMPPSYNNVKKLCCLDIESDPILSQLLHSGARIMHIVNELFIYSSYADALVDAGFDPGEVKKQASKRKRKVVLEKTTIDDESLKGWVTALAEVVPLRYSFVESLSQGWLASQMGLANIPFGGSSLIRQVKRRHGSWKEGIRFYGLRFEAAIAGEVPYESIRQWELSNNRSRPTEKKLISWLKALSSVSGLGYTHVYYLKKDWLVKQKGLEDIPFGGASLVRHVKSAFQTWAQGISHLGELNVLEHDMIREESNEENDYIEWLTTPLLK